MQNSNMTSTKSSSKVSSLRVLVLAPSSDSNNSTASIPPVPFPSFLEKLTETSPSKDTSSFAGYTSHPHLHLKTRYYEADVSLWCDELPPTQHPAQSKKMPNQNSHTVDINDTTTNNLLSEWQTQMSSSEAREVRQVIGAIILLLPFTTSTLSSRNGRDGLISSWTPLIEAVNSVRDAIEDETGREVGSVVLLQESTSSTTPSGSSTRNPSEELLELLEDECLSSRGILGWNFVHWVVPSNNSTNEKGITTQQQETTAMKNEFGEKVGFARVIEVLEGVDWFASSSMDDDDDEDEDSIGDRRSTDSLQGLDFLNNQKFTQKSSTDQELEREMMGLKMAMLDLENIDGIDDEDGPSEKETKSQINGKTTTLSSHEDVWASLDERDILSTGEGDEEIQVEQLQALMEKAIAVREAASELSSSKREKFARREVAKMMKELG